MKPYTPAELPLQRLDYKRLFRSVGEANAELARYDGLLQGIVNPSVMLSPLTNEEAVLSSRIEGTQASVDEVLEHEAGILKKGENADDIQEIVNYRHALRLAHSCLIEQPITLSFVKGLHEILLNSVRGQDKTPGQFRNNQNWIGLPGCTIDKASFVPPTPFTMNDYLIKWQEYLDFNDIDVLLQTAVAHAQFELLHPFHDRNGRIGRILIPLFLFQKKKLSQPVFYLSSYLESNREEYYLGLRNISQKGDWNGWIQFFLNAVFIQAQNNSLKVKSVLRLYEEMKIRIHGITHSQYTIHLLDALFDRPIFQTTDFVRRSGINKKTAMGLLKALRKSKILVVLREASGSRAAVLCFNDLLTITEAKDVSQ